MLYQRVATAALVTLAMLPAHPRLAAAQVPPWYIDEVRVGGSFELEQNARGGFAQFEALLTPLPSVAFYHTWAAWLFTPRPLVGATISVQGRTNGAFGGLAWNVPVPSPLLLEITFGGFVHDQTLFQVYPDRETLTTRFLFRESIAFGIGLDRGWRLLAFADHLSNGHLGQANRGVNKAGLVLGYRFGEGGLNPPPIQAPPPARQFDWAGPFAGFSAGYARGMDDFVIHFVGTPDVAFSGRVGSLHLAAQVGANWMFGRFLAGLEGDFAAQRLEDSTTRFLPIQEEVSVHINWLATARARLGVVIDPPFAGDRLLLYGTGGLASSQFVKRYCDPVINICYLNGNEKEGWIAAEFIKTGWTIGGGAELPLTPHATVKAEYLYIDFSQFSYDYGPFTNDFASRLHVLRAGFNFGFFN